MKFKGIVSFLMVILMAISCIGVYAADDNSSPFKDVKNLSAIEATDLLETIHTVKDRSFVFVFYRDTCGYSRSNVPQFAEYLKEKGIALYGLNDNEYPFWNYWSRFVSGGGITFPLVIAYNYKKDICYSEHSVHSLDSFKHILKEIDIDSAKPGSVFKDIEITSKYYTAVKSLSKQGIITGYSDNSFRPSDFITRSEATAVIARAANLDTPSSVYSSYTDVPYDYWGKKYIMAATKAGIINGVGNKKFAPDDYVTYNQLIKMIICMLSEEEYAQKNGGWPNGYLKLAHNMHIIENYNELVDLCYWKGDNNAKRIDVVRYVYTALMWQANR